MKLERERENVFRLTVTAPELSALAGAARLTLAAMRADPAAPPEAVALLERLLRDYDQSLPRLQDDDGRSARPS